MLSAGYKASGARYFYPELPFWPGNFLVQGIGRVRGRSITPATKAPSTDRNTVLATLGDYIREIGDPDDLAFAAAELLGRSLNVSRAGYGTIDTSAETITINRDWNAPGIASLAGVLHFRDYGSYIENLKRGETVVCVDARKDPRVGDRASAL